MPFQGCPRVTKTEAAAASLTCSTERHWSWNRSWSIRFCPVEAVAQTRPWFGAEVGFGAVTAGGVGAGRQRLELELEQELNLELRLEPGPWLLSEPGIAAVLSINGQVEPLENWWLAAFPRGS